MCQRNKKLTLSKCLQYQREKKKRFSSIVIEKSKEKVGGEPVLVGTPFTVRSVVQYILKQGMTPEELVQEFPQLTLGKIHVALAYYYEHREEIAHLIAKNSEKTWQQLIKEGRRAGKVVSR